MQNFLYKFDISDNVSLSYEILLSFSEIDKVTQ